jgi:glycosyltransferase involved in cell wall biosynthesis
VKIAYVITRADAVGGASVHVRDLAQAMLGRGHQVMVFIGGEGPVTEQLHAAGVPFRGLRFLRRPIRPVQDLRAILELAAAMREFQPDVLSLHTAKAGWIGRLVAARQGIPAIYTPHGWSLGDRFAAPAGLAFRWAEKAAARWAGAIICVCQYEKELALRQRVASAEHLHVVYNGVHDIPPELRAQPGTSPVRIVSVARLDAPKDHVTLFHALAAIPAEGWRLDLVGDGPLENNLMSLARELGIAARVRFLGYRQNPATILGRAGIFVLSSRSEALPRSVLEAMRAGLPVVATRVGGVPEAVVDGVNGLLAPAGESGALAAALARLLGDAELRTRFGAEARRTYERRFGFDRMAQETEAVYRVGLSRSL